MAWIKRNLFFVIGAVIALALLGVAGFYNFSAWKQNSDEREKLNASYAELKRLNQQSPHPGDGKKVDNIKLARDQQKDIRAFIAKAAARFEPIPAIPGGTNVSGEAYASALRQTIDQLQRSATANSVSLPPKYNFSFEAQRQLVRYAPGSLDALARQLGEVKVICDVLNTAKINSLDSVRRERVSADDSAGPQSDYLDLHSTTNELAIITPYEITFRCFSPELGAVLSGFAASPHGLLVKSINIEPAPAALVTDTPGMVPVAPVYVPVPVAPRPPSRFSEEGEAFANRYGRPGAPPGARLPPQAAPAPVYATPAQVGSAPVKTGLQTMLNEKQLKITMIVDVIKLLPPK
jgi:hypothetical protein